MSNFKLKTNVETAETIKRLQNSTGIKPNILSRLAVALSLNIKEQPQPVNSESSGFEINRYSLTGEYDIVYKSLIKQHLGKDVDEKDYFPDLFNAHLARGMKLLEQEYLYAGNYEKLLDNLLGASLDYLKEN